ncbi:putative metalloprotease [Spinactinospora alkalitolerans]|uniref:Putative metalloprotease n=1 Tax=Spinactinospora alkalitolerans TaxID=687207 RepID=A0A852TTZ8_9ACTN|nr:neutral zinc metallopeptidase [Spinactinospora alkalitolerans]NYE46777.1 putative metalloprotease [Spinactinospora alkalitolerans]
MDTIRGGEREPGPEPTPFPPAPPRDVLTGAHPAGPPLGARPPAPPPAAPPVGGPSTAVWLTAGGSALVAAVALTVCATLVFVSLDGTPVSGAKPDPTEMYDARRYWAGEPVEIEVGDHPMYALPAPEAVDCAVPDLNPRSAASWEAFSAEVGGCLDEIWHPRLEELGLRPESPGFHILSEAPDDMVTSDEEGLTLAFYQDRDMSISVLLPSVTEVATTVPGGADERVWVALLAHEYGHHVQGQTEILMETYEMEYAASSENEALDVLRRTELQAECFSGVAVGAFADYDAADASFINETFNGSSGDLDTHGSSGNRMHWFEEGWELDTVEGCNTFAASRTLTG